MHKAMGTVAVWACVLSVVGCSNQVEDPMSSRGLPGSSAAGADVGGAGATQGDQTGSSCPGNNVTQPCTCAEGGNTVDGRQTCNISTGWSTCECAAVIIGSGTGTTGPIGNKSSVVFKWQETMPGSGTCKPGHYFGDFTGFYNSTAMGREEATMSPIGIPLLGTVDFDLRQIGNGEFFEIKDGAMEGYALVVFPFVGDIEGTINCAGDDPTIEAALTNGIYAVFGTEYYFQGKAVGKYNKKDSAFTLGAWAVTEPEDYSVIVRGDLLNGVKADLSKAVYAPIPPLVPGEYPLVEMFVEGGGGDWGASYVGPAVGIGGP
jgi:hypothetical protein